MTYIHLPPGYKPRDFSFRHRTWDDSSPYHANRGVRPPPGRAALLPAPRPRTFRNVPKLTGITLHSMVRDAMKDSAYLHAAGMVLQSILGVRANVHYSRVNIAAWELRSHKAVSVTSHTVGPLAYRFMSSLVDVVLPRIKDWKGVSGGSGDSTGNISFGLSPEAVALFPEIEGEDFPSHTAVAAMLRSGTDGITNIMWFCSKLRYVSSCDGPWYEYYHPYICDQR